MRHPYLVMANRTRGPVNRSDERIRRHAENIRKKFNAYIVDAGAHDLLQTLRREQEICVAGHEKLTGVPPRWKLLKTSQPLRTGGGVADVFELALAMDPLSGLPIIPWSSWSGAIRHTAIEDLFSDAVSAGVARESFELEGRTGQHAVDHAVGAGNTTRLREWFPDEPLRSRALAIVELFGSRTGGGTVRFFDALPHKDSLLLDLDVVNPEYRDYYGHRGERWPLPSDQLKPFFYPVVKAGATFRFGWTAWDGEASDHIEHWLEKTAERGFGAATGTAGYGTMRADTGEGNP